MLIDWTCHVWSLQYSVVPLKINDFKKALKKVISSQSNHRAFLIQSCRTISSTRQVRARVLAREHARTQAHPHPPTYIASSPILCIYDFVWMLVCRLSFYIHFHNKRYKLSIILMFHYQLKTQINIRVFHYLLFLNCEIITYLVTLLQL